MGVGYDVLLATAANVAAASGVNALSLFSTMVDWWKGTQQLEARGQYLQEEQVRELVRELDQELAPESANISAGPKQSTSEQAVREEQPTLDEAQKQEALKQEAGTEPHVAEWKERAPGPEAANDNQPDPHQPEPGAAEQLRSIELNDDGSGSSSVGKPTLAEVERVEDLRRKYEEYQRQQRENEVREHFEEKHDRLGTEPEERERLREEMERRFEEQRRIDEERERQRREQFKEMYWEPEP
jgi:hypothetical protein